MSSLPEEIIENILTRLPVKSISRFRSVSKNWCLLFRNPNFIKNHLNHAILINKFNILASDYGEINNGPCLYTVDNDVLSSFLGHAHKIDYPLMSQDYAPEIVGSCNGLVVRGGRNICIWNPATREYKRLPEPPSADSRSDFGLEVFGFDCKNDDYKVLTIVGFNKSGVSEASIYSLASNSWKELGSIPYHFSQRITSGVLVKGVLHWIAIGGHHVGVKSVVIVCFDISGETFSDVPLPNNYSIKDLSQRVSNLGIWEGKLCLLHEDENDHIDVWTMTNNKWSKHLKITAQTSDISYERPIQTLQNGEILLEGEGMEEGGSGLLSYDHKLERARVLEIHGLPEGTEVDTYIETLVPLNSGTYVGQYQIQ